MTLSGVTPRLNGVYRALRCKKDEAEHYDGIVDAVLTFDELSAWFKEKGIEPEKKIVPKEDSRARLFPPPAVSLRRWIAATVITHTWQ